MSITKSRHWYGIKKLIPTSVYEPILDSYYQSRSLFYNGTNVYCPVCARSFSAFINGHQCPYCGSGRRHRLLYLYLQKKTNFFTDNLNVLHFAPEHCFYKRFEDLKNLQYKTADLNSPRAMEKIDMTDIKYPENTFDVVISSHVLEHVPNDHKAMKELFRILKHNRWSIHQAPIDYNRMTTFEDASIQTEKERLHHYGHMDHKRIYGQDYKKRLEGAGFVVIEDGFAQSFPDADISRYGLDSWEKIYLCLKK